MTPTTNHSRAAAHYVGLLDQLHGEKIMEALRGLEAAQRDAEKASAMCQSRDYDLAQHDAMTARIAFRQALMNAGIDPDIVERAVK